VLGHRPRAGVPGWAKSLRVNARSHRAARFRTNPPIPRRSKCRVEASSRNRPYTFRTTFARTLDVDRPPLPALDSSCYKCRVTAANPLVYPHITHHGDVRSGEPVVEGTRIPVVALVRAHQLGMDFDEILVQFPGLAPEGLHAALLYYLDHRAQIDALIARDLTPPSGALELEV